MNCGIPGPWGIKLSCLKDVTRSSWSHEKELKNRHSTADEWHKQEDLLKQKHTQWDVRAGQGQERDRAVSPGPCFYLLRTVINKGEECSLFEVRISWKQGFTFFLPYLFRGFWPTLSAILGLSGFLWLCFRVLPGQASDLPCSWPWLPFCWFPGILLEPN